MKRTRKSMVDKAIERIAWDQIPDVDGEPQVTDVERDLINAYLRERRIAGTEESPTNRRLAVSR